MKVIGVIATVFVMIMFAPVIISVVGGAFLLALCFSLAALIFVGIASLFGEDDGDDGDPSKPVSIKTEWRREQERAAAAERNKQLILKDIEDFQEARRIENLHGKE